MSYEPEYPGADFLATKPVKKCTHCDAQVLTAQLRDPHGRIVWKNFRASAIERDGRRFYLRHVHPR